MKKEIPETCGPHIRDLTNDEARELIAAQCARASSLEAKIERVERENERLASKVRDMIRERVEIAKTQAVRSTDVSNEQVVCEVIKLRELTTFILENFNLRNCFFLRVYDSAGAEVSSGVVLVTLGTPLTSESLQEQIDSLVKKGSKALRKAYNAGSYEIIAKTMKGETSRFSVQTDASSVALGTDLEVRICKK